MNKYPVLRIRSKICRPDPISSNIKSLMSRLSLPIDDNRHKATFLLWKWVKIFIFYRREEFQVPPVLPGQVLLWEVQAEVGCTVMYCTVYSIQDEVGCTVQVEVGFTVQAALGCTVQAEVGCSEQAEWGYTVIMYNLRWVVHYRLRWVVLYKLR